jgi:hypothetical protein
MAVLKVGEKYQCGNCGHVVVITKDCDGPRICCGRPMKKIEIRQA